MKKTIMFLFVALGLIVVGFADNVEPPMGGFYSISKYENNVYDSESETFITIMFDIFVLIDNSEEMMTVGIDLSGDGKVDDSEVSTMGISYVEIDGGTVSLCQNATDRYIMYFDKDLNKYILILSLITSSDYLGVPMIWEGEY